MNAYGRIGTVIWNVRFSVGMKVGGFTTAHRDYFHTSHAWKLWGRGRLRQYAAIAQCCLWHGGHRWGEWSETVRTCQRRCGSLQFGGPASQPKEHGDG